jgi:hypothetical protein
VEGAHLWMPDGRREPSDDLVEWPGRDNADSSDQDFYRGMSVAPICMVKRSW